MTGILGEDGCIRRRKMGDRTFLCKRCHYHKFTYEKNEVFGIIEFAICDNCGKAYHYHNMVPVKAASSAMAIPAFFNPPKNKKPVNISGAPNRQASEK